MIYYIKTSSWNLLESFVSESISPFSFYIEREYGNNLSRYLDGTNERANYLILSTEEIKGDYVLKVCDDILDKSNIIPVEKSKTLFTYNKTIYYKKDSVFFLFSSNDLLEAFVAESKILFEVKCVEKYKSEFIVNADNTVPLSTDKIANSISFQLQEYVVQDNIYDKLKGLIVAYTCAVAFVKNPQEELLTCLLRDLKNSFAGLNTQIMISESAISNEGDYIALIEKTKEAYNRANEIKTNLFDILLQQFSEITKMAKARAEEISKNKQVSSADNREYLISQKENLERQLYEIEYRDGFFDLMKELGSIKEKERINGIKIGKTREYFRKGTWEYERKQFLRQEIKKYKEENCEYKSIKREIAKLKQLITNIETGASVYDTTLGVLFVRVSDIINELICKAKASGKINRNVDYTCFSLKKLPINIDVYVSVEEKEFFNIIINEALVCKQRILSDDMVLKLIVKSANNFKRLESANTEKGKRILCTLREFWEYKNNNRSSFCIPDDLIVLKSLMAFFIKPFGFDQIERFVQNKGIKNKEYGFMLRGALIGYAAFPKTFTDALYANKDIYIPMDDYLTVIHKQVEAQYSCD